MTEVGCSWGGTRLSTRDLRTSNLELHKEFLPEQVSRLQELSGCNRRAAVEATPSGSSSRKAHAIGELLLIEEDAIGERALEQQPKRTQSIGELLKSGKSSRSGRKLS